MKKLGYFLYLAVTLAILLSSSAIQSIGAPALDLHLMPMPERVALVQGRLSIDSSFSVSSTGQSDSRVTHAIDRLLRRLQNRTGIPVAVHPQPSDPEKATLQIHCGGPGEAVQSIMADESYKLEVTDAGARLDAATPVGVLRGIETFMQLIELDGASFFVPGVRVEDKPRFRWRGLHIDVSRHWEPPEVIRRNLDAMAAVKMNVFHWHLSDDQGFRIESKIFPKLHQKGSEGNYYTQADVREILAYARDRGIRVIPEFDMPGHSTSWLVAYPELASAPGPYEIGRPWGGFEGCLDPTRVQTYSFLDAFIGEMAKLFPDQYFHIGGDEVNEKQWNTSPRIIAFRKRHGLKNSRDLQAYFNERLQKIVAKHGKRMIGWDEILHSNLPKSVLVQMWRKQSTPIEVARKGFSGILSRGYYLDAMNPASFHYAVDPLGEDAAAMTPEESARILGAEACMWAEFVTPDNIDSRIWPRAAAIAERLWSPASVNDVRDMYRRLEYIDHELDYLGLTHRINHIDMLQRIAGDQRLAPLQMLADILLPTKLGIRQRSRNYTSLTPLNRMVDAVLPESNTARHFEHIVQELVAAPSEKKEAAREVRAKLTCWMENRERVSPMIERSFLLKEVAPISGTVAELCSRGLQALDYLESGQKAPEEWQKQTSDLISAAEKPQAEMLPAITGSIKMLADAVK